MVANEWGMNNSTYLALTFENRVGSYNPAISKLYSHEHV